jgi:hypothetical protein
MMLCPGFAAVWGGSLSPFASKTIRENRLRPNDRTICDRLKIPTKDIAATTGPSRNIRVQLSDRGVGTRLEPMLRVDCTSAPTSGLNLL